LVVLDQTVLSSFVPRGAGEPGRHGLLNRQLAAELRQDITAGGAFDVGDELSSSAEAA
jgi:hypothetical protein